MYFLEKIIIKMSAEDQLTANCCLPAFVSVDELGKYLQQILAFEGNPTTDKTFDATFHLYRNWCDAQLIRICVMI